MVAAAPTTVAAIATEAAVSGRAQDTLNIFLPCPCDFPPIKDQELGHNDIKYRNPYLLCNIKNKH